MDEKDALSPPLATPTRITNSPLTWILPNLQIKSMDERHQKRVMCSLDLFISMFVVSPLVIACWRGIWVIMDIYGHIFPGWETCLFAIGVHFSLALLRHHLYTHAKKKTEMTVESFVWKVLRRVYIWFFAVLINMFWRGLWLVMDEYTEVWCHPNGIASAESNVFRPSVTLFVCLCMLFPVRAVKNVIGTPFFIFLDDKKSFLFTTRYKVKMMQGTSWYILDCLFSVIVVGTLVVLVWRGVWVLMDIYIYPDDPIWSAWASTIIGYSIVAVAFSMQPLMRWLCDRIDGCWRLIVCDLFLLLALVGTVNVWRGIWLLLNFYFLPDDLEMSCWITHWASLVLLILMGCSNSLLVRGVFIDAEEPAGKCVVFPCYYLRLIFQQEREKKSKLAQIELMAQRKLEMEKSNHHNPVRINMDANNHM